MKLLRLHGRKTNEYVLRKGRVWKGAVLAVRWLPGAPRREVAPAGGALYAGTFAPGSLSKKAVERNRMRRRCREALRVALQEAEGLQTAQLLLCPRSASLKAPFLLIQEDIRAFLSLLRHG